MRGWTEAVMVGWRKYRSDLPLEVRDSGLQTGDWRVVVALVVKRGTLGGTAELCCRHGGGGGGEQRRRGHHRWFHSCSWSRGSA